MGDRDVLLVTVDSLRADHVGWQGYDRDTTPILDDYAAEGATFSNAFAHACSTRPSFPAILTSASALMYGGYERVADDQTLVSEVFDAAGYDTAGFHSNLYLGADFGYDRGFDEFYDSRTDPSATARLRQRVKSSLDSDGLLYRSLARLFETAERQVGANVGSAYVRADEITDMALEWVESTDPGEDHFLWTHYMDAHHPYVPPAAHQRAFRDDPIDERRAIRLRRKMIEEPAAVTDAELEDLIDLYDAEIRFVDAQVGRLVEAARERWGDVTVLVTADHGEEFREHGRFSHHATFHDEVLHVPMLLHGGERAEEHAGSYDDLVGLLDVSPTLVDLAGLTVPDSFHGYSLRPLLESGSWPREAVVGDWSTDDGSRRFAYRDHEWKYVRRESAAGEVSGDSRDSADGQETDEALYHLPSDPGEHANCLAEPADCPGNHRHAVERIREAIAAHEREVEATERDVGAVEMDEDVRQRLRQLGYRE